MAASTTPSASAKTSRAGSDGPAREAKAVVMGSGHLTREAPQGAGAWGGEGEGPEATGTGRG